MSFVSVASRRLSLLAFAVALTASPAAFAAPIAAQTAVAGPAVKAATDKLAGEAFAASVRAITDTAKGLADRAAAFITPIKTGEPAYQILGSRRGTPDATVRAALEDAAKTTGARLRYLMNTAGRESSFNPQAAARTSSARGLFQFVEATWLEMIGRHGARYGLEQQSRLVSFDRSGRPTIADPKVRDEVLALRYDPKMSALFAAEFTRDNERLLTSALGREPTDGELYVAHFLGGAGAATLITRAAKDDCTAASLFPSAAASNRSIFYNGGRPRSCGEVLQRLI